MRMVSMHNFAKLVCSLALMVVTNAAGAVTLDAGYPAPGGTTFSGGDPSAPGGAVLSYSGFNSSFYDQLWWGPTVDMGTSVGTSPLTSLGAFGSDTMTWSGSFAIPLATGGFLSPTGTFTAVLSSGTWIDPSTVGISGGPLAVTEVTGPYTVMVSFTVGGTAYETYYDGLSTPSGVQSHTDINGDFWYTAPVGATPLPAALPLFASGLGALGLLSWRKKRNKRVALARCA